MRANTAREPASAITGGGGKWRPVPAMIAITLDEAWCLPRSLAKQAKRT